jgi:thiol peroxidase
VITALMSSQGIRSLVRDRGSIAAWVRQARVVADEPDHNAARASGLAAARAICYIPPARTRPDQSLVPIPEEHHSPSESSARCGADREETRMAQPMERPNAFQLKGKPLTLIGPELKVGDRAPDFTLLDQTFAPVTLASTGARVRVFSVVPSLDTGVCTAQTKRWNDESAKLEGRVAFYSISRDLPYAQKRWCSDAQVDKVTTLSDHMDGSFGKSYGAFVKELGVDSRALFVVDAEGVIRHVEYVLEMATQPDYDAAIAAIRKLV